MAIIQYLDMTIIQYLDMTYRISSPSTPAVLFYTSYLVFKLAVFSKQKIWGHDPLGKSIVFILYCSLSNLASSSFFFLKRLGLRL